MSHRRLALAVLIGALSAEGPRADPVPEQPKRQTQAELREQVRALQAELAELHEQDKALLAKLAAIEKRLDSLAAADVESLRAELDDLKESAATHDDLAHYLRKPAQTELHQRFSGEVELWAAASAVRTDQLAQQIAALNTLVTAKTQPLLGALSGIASTLSANDGELRPHVAVRLYWEVNRFINADTFIFASAMPELTAFFLDDDLDRFLLAGDFAHPLDRFAFDFRKAAIGIQGARASLQAGILQFTSGSGFFRNPTNPFTPKNPLDPRREVTGVPAVRADVTLIAREGLTLSGQVDGVAQEVKNDLLGAWSGRLGAGGLAQLRADAQIASVTAIAIYQRPTALGEIAPSFGGIVSVSPFGLTLSAEALWNRTQWPDGDRSLRPDAVFSLQYFTDHILSGATGVLEFSYNAQNPLDTAHAQALLANAVVTGNSLLAADLLTQPLGRRQYVQLYLEPAITRALKLNLGGLAEVGPEKSVIVRAGFDYNLTLITLHAFGGLFCGPAGSEFATAPVSAFVQLNVFAGF